MLRLFLHKKTYVVLLSAASLLLTLPTNAWTETSQAGEYQVKAAYLYHFAKFIEWPANAPGILSQTLTICVLGKSPFGSALTALSGKTVKSRRVMIASINRIEEAKDCDILFICLSEKERLGHILGSISSRPILTISDIHRFVEEGGIIGFVSQSDKIRFEINLRGSQRCSLLVSAQLLKLATSVAE